jgi:hypothetical protein
MIISNIGGISMSLPHSLPHLIAKPTTHNSSIAFQVNLISIANTGARILVGILADFISSAGTYLPTGVKNKPIISKFVFLFGSAVLLLVTFIWMDVGVQSQGNLWALRCQLCFDLHTGSLITLVQHWDWSQLQHCPYGFVSDTITRLLMANVLIRPECI